MNYSLMLSKIENGEIEGHVIHLDSGRTIKVTAAIARESTNKGNEYSFSICGKNYPTLSFSDYIFPENERDAVNRMIYDEMFSAGQVLLAHSK